MLKVANIFSNDMVLQRDKNITVWGLGDEERTVTVTLNGVSVQTQVCDGRWTAVLPPMSAGGEYEMTVSDGCTEKKFCRIMIGEVWFCGGQSNMELELQNAKGGKEVLENLTPDCNVRFYYTQKRGTLDEMFYEDENNTAWSQASKDNSRAWSAVGFFFGRKLAKDLGVTVGLIGCNWGGTSASAWVDRPTLENNAEIRSYIDEYEKRIEGKTVDEQIKEYRDYQKFERVWDKKYGELLQKDPTMSWEKANEILGDKNWPGPINCVNPFRPTGLFETMVSRVCPYTIKGFLYYQGESDDHKPDSYYTLLTSLIKLWREKWGDDELPFIIVQLPMFKYAADPDYKHWCKIREAQMRAYKTVKNTGIAVISDCGEFNEIHPKEKVPVGERLCLQAEKLFYGMDVKAFGPIYKSLEYKNGGIELSFDHAENGFVVKGEAQGFEIAGKDEEFVKADITINGSKIFIKSDAVEKPLYARYNWFNYCEVTIFNETGIPLAPFRTEK